MIIQNHYGRFMEDNSGKKFSLQDWVMNRAANQSGAVVPSYTGRRLLSEDVPVEEEVEQQVEQPVEVSMKSVSNGSTISSPLPRMMKERKEESPKEDKKDLNAAMNASQNPLQQLQIVKLMSELGERLRQSEKEREILWKEVEICRKQISDLSGNTSKTEKSFSDLENQINQREVYVKELVEKQISLEQQFKDQITSFDSSRAENTKFQEKLTSVETATGSAIIRVEDAIAENSKLSKRVEQMGQDKARLIRKLEVVEETLAHTQETLKAKALVLLTDQSLVNKTQLPQMPAWTGDDTLRISRPASSNPATHLASSLRPPKQINFLTLSLVTALISGAAGLGAIWLIKNYDVKPKTDLSMQTESSSSSSDLSAQPVSENQETLMAEAAKIANQIEPSALAKDDEVLENNSQAVTIDSISAIFKPAEDAQLRAIESFQAAKPVGDVSTRILSDKSLPKALKALEKAALGGDANAQHDLAILYTSGQAGLKVDFTRASKWFQEAAYNGSSNAQYNLGVLYHQGLGVGAKDTAKAIELYRVAAFNNHPEALYNLAIAYVEGVGVEYNPPIASVYFERAAQAGIVEAAYNLGLLHENGLLGESQPDEAVFWYKMATDKGNSEAKKLLDQLKIKLSMTDSDVERIAQKVAKTKPDFMSQAGQARLPDMVRDNVPPLSQPSALPKATSPSSDSQKTEPETKSVSQKTSYDPVIISQIQEQMIRLELYNGVPDGQVSDLFTKAISSYQQKNGLKVDGLPSDDLLVQILASASQAKRASN